MNDFDKASIQIRIPVRIENGRVNFFYPGPLPEMRNGAVGDLVVDRSFVLNQADVERLEHQEDQELLPKGTVLRVAVEPKQDIPGAVLIQSPAEKMDGASATHYVEVVLQEALVLRLRGTKLGVLRASRCEIPTLKRDAETLNRAYSLIAEHYEAWRSSTTGNVFMKAYYCSADGAWHNLDRLRQAAMADLEARLYLPQTELFGDRSRTGP
jgi:hypothetical protein